MVNDYEPYLERIKKSASYLDTSTYEKILEKIGNAQIVLLGEATHGTHEFYDIRSEITKKLITEKNFNAIAIEGDWPDAYNINTYINNQRFNNAEALLLFCSSSFSLSSFLVILYFIIPTFL
jgi:erythromycin esterase-like protein